MDKPPLLSDDKSAESKLFSNFLREVEKGQQEIDLSHANVTIEKTIREDAIQCKKLVSEMRTTTVEEICSSIESKFMIKDAPSKGMIIITPEQWKAFWESLEEEQ